METLEYIDTHAHLTMLEHAPLDDILDRARTAGVRRLVSVSTDESNWESNRKVAEERNLFYSLGLHPHEAGRWKKLSQPLNDYFKEGVPERCVGIGETGLDFHYNLASREDQIESFEAHVELAKQVKLPLIIHSRDAFDELFAAIARIGMGTRAGVMHCFTGNYEEGKRAIDLGLKISFSGILTFKNANDIRDAAKRLPLSELMVETDCPYLAPIPHRGKPNEPAYVALTAKFLSEVRATSLEEIAPRLVENASKLFGI